MLQLYLVTWSLLGLGIAPPRQLWNALQRRHRILADEEERRKKKDQAGEVRKLCTAVKQLCKAVIFRDSLIVAALSADRL